MNWSRFLNPKAFRLFFPLLIRGIYDRLTNKPPLPLRVRDYVAEFATRGDPNDVLATMDRYATRVQFLMNIGPAKGPLVKELVERLPPGARVLELGAFCGYSSILFASALGADSRIVSLEWSRASVEGASANAAFAGLDDRIDFIQGDSGETIPTLEGPFDLVFIDHSKPLYLRDLKLIEEHGLLRPGSIVVADNVGPILGDQNYLEYVRGCGHYETEYREATIEYTDVPDGVEISIYRGA